jgi:ADP-ribosyl-[dinitrogen reductase] hydrolase
MTIDREALTGCLLGLAVGDALGLPLENLSPRRAGRLFPNIDRHHFFFRHGVFSDDTEHACLTGQALLVSGGDPTRFRRDLARRLRWWAAGLPAGTGRATIRACTKLWLGWSPEHSGVFSAGNGPAMRAPLLGLCLGGDPDRLRHFVRISTRLTHTDPKAECGAIAVALAAHLAASSRATVPPEPAGVIDQVRELMGSEQYATPLHESLGVGVTHLKAGRTTEEYAAALGLRRGVSGYMYHTVPVALYAWLRHPDDYRAAVQSAIRCGGDTDTVAAITGALVGARVGKAGIPAEWLGGIIDWPRSVGWVERLAGRLADGKWRSTPQRPEPLAVWALPARNAAFLAWVLVHAGRRLLPPY